jgi:hypothetical protein
MPKPTYASLYVRLGAGSPMLRDPGSVVAVTSWKNNVDSSVLVCDGARRRLSSHVCARRLHPCLHSFPLAGWAGLARWRLGVHCAADHSQHTKALQGIGPHVAPLGAIFYRATPTTMFPNEYNNTLFVAVHGSLHR